MLDFRGQSCPQPVLGIARKARAMPPGSVMDVVADDPAFRLDLESWCRSTGATVVHVESNGKDLHATVRTAGGRAADAATLRLDGTGADDVDHPDDAGHAIDDGPTLVSLRGIPASQCIAELRAKLSGRGGEQVRVVADHPGLSGELVQWISTSGHNLLSLEARDSLQAEIKLCAVEPPTTALVVPQQAAEVVPSVDNQATLLVLHNDREALLAALLVAVGAAAQGMNVMMFFTFWGLNLLRGETPNEAVPTEKVSWAQRMFKWMMPGGPKRQRLGKLNMGGVGGRMLGSIMKRYDLMDVPELMAAAEEQGIRFVACTMSMQVMGITKRDLAPREKLEYGGVAAFVESAGRSRISLTF